MLFAQKKVLTSFTTPCQNENSHKSIWFVGVFVSTESSRKRIQ